jgi:hypothetical protein
MARAVACMARMKATQAGHLPSAQKAPARMPAEMRADEAAEGGSADVEAHDEGDAVRRPIFASGSAKAGLGWERPLRQSVTTSSRPNSQHTRVESENVRIRTSSHHL